MSVHNDWYGSLLLRNPETVTSKLLRWSSKGSCPLFWKFHSEYPWVTSSFDTVVFHLSWDTTDMHPTAYSAINVAYILASYKPKVSSNHHENFIVDDVPKQ